VLARCTVFSISEAELQPAGDETIPSYDELSSKVSKAGKPHLLELGVQWSQLHEALGSPRGDQLLGFLAAGGEPVTSLEDGPRSSGRFFGPAVTTRILAATVLIEDKHVAHDELRQLVRRLRVFLAEVVLAERGIIVHQFV
jgi:hypothetical protein